MNYWAPNYDFAFVGLQITGGTSPESQTPSKGSVFALRLVTTNRSRVETPVRTTSTHTNFSKTVCAQILWISCLGLKWLISSSRCCLFSSMYLHLQSSPVNQLKWWRWDHPQCAWRAGAGTVTPYTAQWFSCSCWARWRRCPAGTLALTVTPSVRTTQRPDGSSSVCCAAPRTAAPGCSVSEDVCQTGTVARATLLL